ncbi:MAG: cytochrome P450, partial [Pseudomonadota bacterium]|nr:cytochrome P450 [Pseudomonadota bacterium]
MTYVEVGAALTSRPREAGALALKAASAEAPAPAYAQLGHAGLDKMKAPGAAARLVSWVLDDPRWAFSILRRVWPTPVVKGWGLITRYDDVVEALKQDRIIAVPFGPKIEALNDGPNFLLGMADGDDYRRLQGHVRAAFPPEDNQAVIAPLAAAEARAIIEASPGRLDAVRDLITRVPTEICEKHYGVKVPDEVRFGEWTIAMSTFMFGDPTNNPT